MTDDDIQQLEQFKNLLIAWDTERVPKRRMELRSTINQSVRSVRRQVIEARCYHTVTIGPPPAVGGLILQNQDPFVLVFDPPWGIDLVPGIMDMVDQTIGGLK